MFDSIHIYVGLCKVHIKAFFNETHLDKLYYTV